MGHHHLGRRPLRFAVAACFQLAVLAVAVAIPCTALVPQRADELYNRALRLDELRAIPLLLRAHKMAPKNPQIVYRLGFLYQKMSRLVEAERYYLLTISLSHCHLKALNNMGGLRLDQRRDVEARDFYLRAVKCRGTYYLPYYNLAGLYLEAGNLTDAVKMYRAAIKRNSKHPASHHNLGIAYERLAKTDAARAAALREKAVEHLRTACELEPKNALNHFNYGRLLFNLNRMTEIEAPLRRAISLAPGDSRLIGRALAMIAQIPPPTKAAPETKKDSPTPPET